MVIDGTTQRFDTQGKPSSREILKLETSPTSLRGDVLSTRSKNPQYRVQTTSDKRYIEASLVKTTPQHQISVMSGRTSDQGQDLLLMDADSRTFQQLYQPHQDETVLPPDRLKTLSGQSLSKKALPVPSFTQKVQQQKILGLNEDRTLLGVKALFEPAQGRPQVSPDGEGHIISVSPTSVDIAPVLEGKIFASQNDYLSSTPLIEVVNHHLSSVPSIHASDRHIHLHPNSSDLISSYYTVDQRPEGPHTLVAKQIANVRNNGVIQSYALALETDPETISSLFITPTQQYLSAQKQSRYGDPYGLFSVGESPLGTSMDPAAKVIKNPLIMNGFGWNVDLSVKWGSPNLTKAQKLSHQVSHRLGRSPVGINSNTEYYFHTINDYPVAIKSGSNPTGAEVRHSHGDIILKLPHIEATLIIYPHGVMSFERKTNHQKIIMQHLLDRTHLSLSIPQAQSSWQVSGHPIHTRCIQENRS